MNKIDEILAIVSSASAWAALIPGAGTAVSVAGVLIRIAQAANKAHQDITGKPIDLTTLHEIEHVD